MNDTTILIVDDEASITEVVSLYLSRAGYRVQTAQDGRSALRAMAAHMPDLVVLDVMLPEVDGLEITRRVRAEGTTPIILLTARKEEADRILGLELGADDYVVKPFSPQELVSRVRAVLRRTQGGAPEQNATAQAAIAIAGLHIDPAARTVTKQKEALTFTPKEFDLLWLLASHPNRVFKRQELMEQVWGESQYLDPSTVTVHVRRLREKIEADPAKPTRIVTVWGVGYKFEDRS
ncbi:MAG: response regulator transcription factor [Caldilineaceae bacterium]|nr:response regulator transcription factor [Caldilineaceae bacterium]